MTGTTRTAEGLDARRRKLLFRSWHRGMREMDLVLGRFADSRIGDLTDVEIDQYERLLDIPDTDLLTWVTGERPVPDAMRSTMLDTVLGFGRSMTFDN